MMRKLDQTGTAPRMADTPRLPRDAWRWWRLALEEQPYRSTPYGPRRRLGGPVFHAALDIFVLGLKTVGMFHRGRRNALAVERRRLELRFPHLPEVFDGYRLLHVTDPHLDGMPGLTEAIVRAVAEAPVDLCVMTGDYRSAMYGPHEPAVAHMARLTAAVRARDGIFVTLGNHDTAHMVEPFEALGLTVLVNETMTLRRGLARLVVTGTDDPHRFYTPLAEHALAMAAIGPEAFGIALVHSPDLAIMAERHGFSLYLCGHTHGGQIATPGGRPIFSHLDRPSRHLGAGLWRHGRLVGYTSSGAGVSGQPLRFFTRPEVTEVVLRRG